MRAIWIKSEERTITAVDYNGLEDLKRMVGGWIEVAAGLPRGDVLYVDEEGLLKNLPHGFVVPWSRQILAGNGVIVGPEIGDTANTQDPSIQVGDLAKLLLWMPRG